MTARSSRNKIRWQIQKAIEKCDGILLNLQYADDLALGRSNELSVTLPDIIRGVDTVKDALIDLRDAI